MKFQDIIELSKEDLRAMLEEADRSLFTLRSQRSQERKLEKPHLIRAKRKERAQILTQLSSMKKKERKDEKKN